MHPPQVLQFQFPGLPAGRQPPPAQSQCAVEVLHSQAVRPFGLCYFLPATFGGSADRAYSEPTATLWRELSLQFPGLLADVLFCAAI